METKEIGRSVSIAIAALLFGTTMILSAVGPARANERIVQSECGHPVPPTVRYLA